MFPPSAALCARHLRPEPRNQRIPGIARHIDDGLVPAGSRSGNRQSDCARLAAAFRIHDELYGVGKVHRRAGFVLALGHWVLFTNAKRREHLGESEPAAWWQRVSLHTLTIFTLNHPAIAHKRPVVGLARGRWAEDGRINRRVGNPF